LRVPEDILTGKFIPENILTGKFIPENILTDWKLILYYIVVFIDVIYFVFKEKKREIDK